MEDKQWRYGEGIYGTPKTTILSEIKCTKRIYDVNCRDVPESSNNSTRRATKLQQLYNLN